MNNHHHQVLLFWLILTIWSGESYGSVSDVQEDESSRKKHHLLFFMGGLKSIAAIVLIKIKIVLALATVVAIVMFTVKYLMGATGLPGFLYKDNGPPIPPPPASHHYLPVVHEPVYGYGSEYSSSPWDHSNHEIYHSNQEIHHGHDWSKIGDGGRSLLDFINFYPQLEEILLHSFFHHKKKKMRKRDFISSRKYK